MWLGVRTMRGMHTGGPQEIERRLKGVPILIVEDEPSNARMLAAVLASEGADVRVAFDAESGLEMLRTFAARVAVVDLLLPRMSGLELARGISTNPATCHVKIVAVSVLCGSQTESLARDNGCGAYLQKPIEIEALVGSALALLD